MPKSGALLGMAFCCRALGCFLPWSALFALV